MKKLKKWAVNINRKIRPIAFMLIPFCIAGISIGVYYMVIKKEEKDKINKKYNMDKNTKKLKIKVSNTNFYQKNKRDKIFNDIDANNLYEKILVKKDVAYISKEFVAKAIKEIISKINISGNVEFSIRKWTDDELDIDFTWKDGVLWSSQEYTFTINKN